MRVIWLCAAAWLAGASNGAAAEVTVARGQILRQPQAWFAGEQGRGLADNVVAQQSPQGGWTNWTNEGGMLRAATKEEQAKNNHGSIDDGATTTQLRILGRVIAANGAEAALTQPYRAAFLRGLEFLFAAQYPNGGWPQHFPAKDYRANITFNDDAMLNVVTLLRDVAAGKSADFAWVNSEQRSRAAAAVAKAVECVVQAQVVIDGKKTAWGAQHDPKTLAPAAARKFEPVSLTGHETVGLVRMLMGVETPTREIIAAVTAAVAWLEQVKITGIRLERFTGPEGRDARVVADPTAPPLWARFYELGTNRPIFAGRDGVVKYSLAEIERERRGGYGWYSERARDLLEKEYPRWRARVGRE